VLAVEWEAAEDIDSKSGISTQSLGDEVFASTIQASLAADKAGDELDDAEIERSIREINEAIQRSSKKRELRPPSAAAALRRPRAHGTMVPFPIPSRVILSHELSTFRRPCADALRPVTMQRHYTRHAEGSVLVAFGHTQVLCTASVDEKVPPHKRGSGEGWVTAEYGMLPRATHTRSDREAAAASKAAARRRSSA
jgi:hypothetical protein